MSVNSFSWPSAVVLDDPANGTPNQAAPGVAKLVAGEDAGQILRPILTNTVGNLLLTNDSIVKAQLQDNAGTGIVLGQHVMASSLSVVVASDQTVPISAASLPLPTGASTSALQTQISGQLPGTLGQKTSSNSLAVTISSDQSIVPTSVNVGGSAIDPRSIRPLTAADVVTANQGGAPWTVKPTDGTNSQAYTAAGEAKVSVTQPLPAGANVIGSVNQGTNPWTIAGTVTANQGATPYTDNITQVGGSAITLGQKAAAASLPVVLSSDQTPALGRTSANAPVYNVYSTTNVTTAAYTQLVASTTSQTNFLDIFDSSGQAMILATGASGSEVIQGYIAPGGAQLPLKIPAGSRVAYKALTANATSGYVTMSFYG
jgi:hypothetical protein